MPIYEFCCHSCGREFETLVMGSNEKVECPQCQSKDVKRMLSCFSTKDSGGISLSGGGGCAPKGGFS